MSAKPMTKKEWLAFLDKAISEFDWSAAHEPTPTPWAELSDERIKGIFYAHGQYVSGKEIALVRCIEAVLKENR